MSDEHASKQRSETNLVQEFASLRMQRAVTRLMRTDENSTMRPLEKACRGRLQISLMRKDAERAGSNNVK
jgi:hypothetical protein